MNELATSNLATDLGSLKPAATSSNAKDVENKTVAANVEQNDSQDVESGLDAPESLNSVVKNMNGFIESMQRDLSFSIDKESGREVVSVMDKHTKEVIRQIPSEEALELMRNLDRITGLLFDTKA